MTNVRFPNGITVRAVGLVDRSQNAGWRTFGLYLDPRWSPMWRSTLLDWDDFGLPVDWDIAAQTIKQAYLLATDGEHVEIGCLGGLGRTGTVLACMAVLAGVAPEDAVAWVRANYDARAVETIDQESWVVWFASRASSEEQLRTSEQIE